MKIPTAQTVTLERHQLKQVQQVSIEFLQDPIFNFEKEMGEFMLMKLATYAWGVPRQEHIAKYPSNTWQMFKKEYMPKWFTDRYPIEYISIMANLLEVMDKRISIPKGIPTLTLLTNLEHELEWPT